MRGALAPIFARLKNKKCPERAENLTETLATQANRDSFIHWVTCYPEDKMDEIH